MGWGLGIEVGGRGRGKDRVRVKVHAVEVDEVVDAERLEHLYHLRAADRALQMPRITHRS